MEDELLGANEAELSPCDPFDLSWVVSNGANSPHEELVVPLEHLVLLFELLEPLLKGLKPRDTAFTEDERWDREKGCSNDQAWEKDHKNTRNGGHRTH